MRTARILAAVTAGAAAALMLAPSAAAYDREAYEYAAGHMIERSDIPKSLGTFEPILRFGAEPSFEAYLCFVPSGDEDTPGTDVKATKGRMAYSADYTSPKADGPSVRVLVTTFSSSTAAIKAFNTIKAKAKQCTGSGASTFTGEDGTSYTSSWSVSNAVVPAVAVAGVQSISITQDNLSTSSDSDKQYLNDNYAVYSLVNDAIIQTAYYVNGPTNLTTAQRKSVNQVAFNAVGRWVG